MTKCRGRDEEGEREQDRETCDRWASKPGIYGILAFLSYSPHVTHSHPIAPWDGVKWRAGRVVYQLRPHHKTIPFRETGSQRQSIGVTDQPG